MIDCSTCDNYRFVDGPDGMLERCGDCFEQLLAVPVCRVHGRRLNEIGRCPRCRAESVAAELLIRAHIAATSHTVPA